jgi:hypothetical protein
MMCRASSQVLGEVANGQTCIVLKLSDLHTIMRYPLLIEQTGPEFGTTETNIAVIILVVAVITVVVVGVVAAEVEA